MRKLISLLFMFALQLAAFGCPVCERNKPKLLQGITHGTGPDSQWDYVVVFAMIIVAILTLFYSIKWLIHPNEKSLDHIKLSILNEQ